MYMFQSLVLIEFFYVASTQQLRRTCVIAVVCGGPCIEACTANVMAETEIFEWLFYHLKRVVGEDPSAS